MSLPNPTLTSIVSIVAEETGLPKRELSVLLGWVLSKDRAGLIRDSNDTLPMSKVSEFKAAARRRQEGEPVAYIIGVQEFYSRQFYVNSNVLIPRPETEELVERALQFLQRRSHESLLTSVLDVGCGSGVIGITLALENPLLQITAVDISQEALEVTRQNAKFHRLNNFKSQISDVYDGLEHSSFGPGFDLIVSNPPYIAAGDPHLAQGDLRFEPSQALTDQADGLSFYRRLARGASQWLRPNGAVLVEHGFDQQNQVQRIFKKAGFLSVEGFNDLSGHPRMVLAQIQTPQVAEGT